MVHKDNNKQTRLLTLNPGLPGDLAQETYITSYIQLTVSLSPLLSLIFPQIISTIYDNP